MYIRKCVLHLYITDVCIYVCMYVDFYLCMYVLRKFVCIYVCMYVDFYLCMYVLRMCVRYICVSASFKYLAIWGLGTTRCDTL
jgi:hypothetical protein